MYPHYNGAYINFSKLFRKLEGNIILGDVSKRYYIEKLISYRLLTY